MKKKLNVTRILLATALFSLALLISSCHAGTAVEVAKTCSVSMDAASMLIKPLAPEMPICPSCDFWDAIMRFLGF